MQKIVFNPHYLMYVDTAIAELWRCMALPYEASLAALGGDLFVKKTTIQYHASAVYDDILDVGLRYGRVGNSSIEMIACIFKGNALLVSATLIYVFANPHTKTSITVPSILRDIFLAYEQGQAMVQVEEGTWATMGKAVLSLRPENPADANTRHTVMQNRLGLSIAAKSQGEVFEMDLMQGAGWGELLR